MTFRGFILRLVYLALFTWIVGSINDSFVGALFLALPPLWFYEILRPRYYRVDPEENPTQPTTMPHPRAYQPELHPHLIKGLHYEAKLRGVPMTVLLRSIVAEALEPTEGMQRARQEVRETGESFLVEP